MVIRSHFECGESAVTVIADKRFHPAIQTAIMDARGCILRQIEADPFFASTLEPYSPPGDNPLVDRMCQASIKAQVGPMAAVAGAVAEHALRAAMDEGCSFVVVDNGGDIALHTDREVTIGLHGEHSGLRCLGLRLPPVTGILGICSSSGRIGPSLSFGVADISTVISEDVILADATATHLGNLVRNSSPSHLQSCVEEIMGIPGTMAALVSADGNIAACGELPELVPVKHSDDLITRRVMLG
ncbi:MAG: UPF0280 family protein [Candidatus Methanomethylophilaceae archaeon]|nr:UPF0280 family protein [Candidatus Methanomethylophilaceae archaeon]